MDSANVPASEVDSISSESSNNVTNLTSTDEDQPQKLTPHDEESLIPVTSQTETLTPSSSDQSPSEQEDTQAKSNSESKDQIEQDAEQEITEHQSAKTTFFPKHKFMFTSEETESNTNANAKIYITAEEDRRRRRHIMKKKLERQAALKDNAKNDDGYSSDDDSRTRHHRASSVSDVEDEKDLYYKNLKYFNKSKLVKEKSHGTEEDFDDDDDDDDEDEYYYFNDDYKSPEKEEEGSRHPRIMVKGVPISRSLSRAGGQRHRSALNELPSSSPAREFTPQVAFDTVGNKEATDFSLTLRYKHQDYEYSRSSRTFMCGTDNNKYSENAVSWLIRELVEDGDEVVCFRVVENGKLFILCFVLFVYLYFGVVVFSFFWFNFMKKKFWALNSLNYRDHGTEYPNRMKSISNKSSDKTPFSLTRYSARNRHIPRNSFSAYVKKTINFFFVLFLPFQYPL